MSPEGPLWARVDARCGQRAEVDPSTVLAGLSLVARQLRMAARQNWQGARVEVEDESARARIQRSISRRPPPPGFDVEIALDGEELPEDRRYVSLDAMAVYAADELTRASAANRTPEPFARIEGPADVRRVEKRLAVMIRKSIDQDGIVSYYAFRPISRLMTRAVLNTRVAPNHVSSVAMLCGVAAAVVAAFGGYYPVLAAGILYWVGAVIDCVDGEIARLRIEGSKMGEWLDTLADDVSTYGLLAGLGIGLVTDGYDPLWNAIGIGGAAVGFLVQAKIYYDLHRWKMTIDTAQYPWFFGAPSEGGAAEGGLGGRLFYAIGFFFRRDAFVTGIAILLALDLRRVATATLAAGVVIVLFLFLLHVAVTALRREAT